MLFSLQNVCFAYRPGVPVIDGVTRELRPGLTVLQGPSGGGKSTLLKLLAGYLSPQAGRVTTADGRPPGPEFQRREIGFVFQQFNLLPGATLARNLELAGAIAGLPPAEIARGMARWLGRLGMESFAAARVEHLSGGQVQRAALARALIKEPSILLLDEPTSGLDDASVALIGEVVLARVAGGRSAIVSTHDPRLPEAMAGGIGEIIRIGAA